MSRNYVIFDCDGGSDDAWALLLLLKAEAENKISLLGITICGSGNTSSHNAAYNMLRILKASGRDEIPIFMGAADSLISPDPKDCDKCEQPPPFHGKDGFGDVLPHDDDIDVEEMVEGEHAVAAIHQFCIEHPKEVTVIAVGPLTNIALCYSMYGKEFAKNIKDLYIMGGNHQGVGNMTRAAEFNFYCDPEAAHIVLTKSKCPITILPWEPCMEDRFKLHLKWRLEEFGPQASALPVVALLNTVEHAQYTAVNAKTWNPCDAMLVAAYLFEREMIRIGNYTRAAEFNFYSDPEAAHIVLTKSKCPMTILPWEPCMEDRFNICLKWRFEEFGPRAAGGNQAIELLNIVEKAQYTACNCKTWNPCGAMLVAAFLFNIQVIRKQSLWSCWVALSGHTRGQMVLDHLHEIEKYPKNIRLIELVNAEFFKHVTAWSCGLKDLRVEMIKVECDEEEQQMEQLDKKTIKTEAEAEVKIENGEC